ncbi:hypothetical protein GCM10011575_31570 [Microlunatus endophyticus]|uniref:Ribosomal RNA adenine methylase transferase N-terminal domain-containing protein n=1 Tax=Microlunatus endophyticus TaxID=1716077 RepID=A0A917SDW3_9ACTN|nr:hypothetical protein GCM10011575_31570 [Microlunatus endophyticus]
MITTALATAGARVLAVELHPGRVDQLRQRFAAVESVRVIELDLLDFRLPQRPFQVVANPPWSLAKSIIRMLTEPGSRLLSADLILSRRLVTDVARRGVPGPGQDRFGCEVTGRIPAAAFEPAPPHPAAVLRISRRSPLPATRRRPDRR